MKAFAVVAVLLSSAVLSGCGAKSSADDALPPGVIAIWGSPGRIDGTFFQPRVIDCPGDSVAVIDKTGWVQFFDAEGRFLDKFTLKNTEKGYPTGMTVTADGNVWIAETHAYRAAEYTRDGKELAAIGGEGKGDGQFVYVTDVAVSAAGDIYASDFGGDDRVQQFDREGRFVRKWGGTGTEPGKFRRPQALAFAPDGSLFVADACNDRIQKFTPDGRLVGVYGGPGTGEGQLGYPYDLAISPDGTVYIAEYGNCRVQRMTTDGRFSGTWGRAGSRPGELAQPWAVALDGKGRLYVLDTGNSRVVVLDPCRAAWTPGPKGG